MKERFREIEPYLLILLVLGGAVATVWAAFNRLPFVLMIDTPVVYGVARSLSSSIVSVALIFAVGILYVLRKVRRLHKTQNWLIEVARYQGSKIGAFCPYEKDTENVESKGIDLSSKWPWGQHHTEYLGHLDAAARKFWVLYEPSDPSTAPTNDMVSDWLQSDRKISREKARAIASMLRPDGLPTGPRR
jgi:hypothetical protein